MFKKIVHYFASRSLEKHRVKTQCMIEQYELEAAQCKANIERQATQYEDKLQVLSRQREKELNAFIGLFNTHLGNAAAYVEQLKGLQKQIFVCLEDWMSKSLCEQRQSLLKDQYRLVDSNIELLKSFKAEIEQLSRQDGHHAWSQAISDRSPRVSTPGIEGHIRNFEKEIKQYSRQYEPEIRRIDSRLRELNNQLRHIKSLQRDSKDEVKPAQEKFWQSKQTLHALYDSCHHSWSDLGRDFESYYQNTLSESDLANKWISQMEYGGTFREIEQIIYVTGPDWQQAKNNMSSLRERMNLVKARIDRAHKLNDFSTIEEDKKERHRIHLAIVSASDNQNELYEARKVFFTRKDEIEAFLKQLKRFHPSNTAQQVYELIAQHDSNLYWNAIGLRTKTIQPPIWKQR